MTSEAYKVRPSQLLDLVDPYTSYCLDEACAYITNKMKAGENPTFTVKYKSFAELYANYE